MNALITLVDPPVRALNAIERSCGCTCCSGYLRVTKIEMVCDGNCGCRAATEDSGPASASITIPTIDPIDNGRNDR